MISICKRFEFDAAHHLTQYAGKCRNVHGHRFILDVEITGEIQKEGFSTGMIMDFGTMKVIIGEIIDQYLDHHDLNETLPVSPTAENIVIWIAEKIKKFLTEETLLRVRLYETPTSYAEWRA